MRMGYGRHGGEGEENKEPRDSNSDCVPGDEDQNTCQPTRFAKSGSRPRSLRSERHMVVARAGTMTSAIRGARGPAWSVNTAPINVTTTATTPDAALPKKEGAAAFFWDQA